MTATIQQRNDRGTWRVVAHRGGKRKRWEFATEKEARAKADALNAAHAGADSWLVDDGSSFTQEALRGWLETYKPTLSKGYEVTAGGLIEGHLVPAFGLTPLGQITRERILAYIDRLFVAEYSSAVAMNSLSILRRVCQLYLEAGIIDRNPAARCGELVAQVARRYATEVRRIDPWTRQEAAKLLDLAREHEPRLYGPLLCALHTGMRRGEILGLEWQDVGASAIAVRRAWVKGESGTPKSGKARDIPLSATLTTYLDELRATVRSRDAFRPVGPVFQPQGGGRWDESNFGRAYRRLMPFAIEAGVRSLRFHDARHTFASWAIDAGQSIKWVQERLGHSSPELTLRQYAHLMRSEGNEMGWLDQVAPTAPPSAPRVRRLKRAKSAE